MLKQTITYTDFDGVDRTETLHFNLSQNELMKLELETDLSLTSYLDRIIKSKNKSEIMKAFDKIICMAYGIKSDDGKRFVKNDEILAEFKSSAAYDEFYMSFFTGEDVEGKMVRFIEGIMPSKLIAEAKKTDDYKRIVTKKMA